MAEFCLECFNEQWGKKLTEKEVKTVVCLCEGCAEYKPCVIKVRRAKKPLLFSVFKKRKKN